MDIFNAMKNGLTEKEIYEAFGAEMTKAKEKLKAESEKVTKEKAIDAARKDVLTSIKNYCIVLGALDPEDWDEEADAELEAKFKALETMIVGLIELM